MCKDKCNDKNCKCDVTMTDIEYEYMQLDMISKRIKIAKELMNFRNVDSSLSINEPLYSMNWIKKNILKLDE